MASSHRVHFFHLVWSTKDRKNVILPKIQEKLYPYIAGIIRKTDGVLLEIGGIANHVHLLIELSNLDRFTSLVRNTKAASTSWLKQEFPECATFAWQDGFGSFSVSYSQLDRTREYIKLQEEHHRSLSFEEEYVKMLNLHQVKFDHKYVLD